ncbi:MAG: hypothetical protein Q9Q40_14920 [Acidobacteriota bacterium]|nr:hypothetical protein [Acidobacteriota bacterium]
MTSFRAIRGWMVGVAVVALLVGSVVVASNMGFKFVPQIPDGQAFNLSLPWNNNYTNAQSLLTDLGNVTRVAKFEANSAITNWTGTAGVNFGITKAEAYIAYGGTGGATPVVVGSHDPNYTLNFTSGQAFNAAAPYHQTLTNAEQLRTDIESQFPGSLDRLAKFEADSALTNWTGNAGVNFSLDLGAGVIIYTKTDVSGYQWPHY